MTIRVETRHGALEGVDAAGIAVFRGIPYARPPVGPRRYRPPEPPAAWPGPRDATKSGPAAPQKTAGFGAFSMGIGLPSEDCLYLNVWTPRPDAGRRPVMVWIHGGAFVLGAGSQPIYDGAALARRGDVVVVTINYRLGALGFLALRDLTGGRVPAGGNEGLLDQIAALEWVRDEIAAFGGDPGNVTIFGESAGAMSCAALLGAPRARGLFHRAILESGSANYVSSGPHATRIAAALLAGLDLSPDRAERLLELSPSRIVDAQQDLFWTLMMSQQPLLARLGPVERRLLLGLNLGLTLGRRRLGRAGTYARTKLLGLMRRRADARGASPAPGPAGLSAAERGLLPFEPVVDGDVLPRPPFEAIRGGLSKDVTVLVGTNLDESRLFSLADPDAADMDERALRDRCDDLARALGGGIDGRQIVEAHRDARAARGESTTAADVWFAVESERTMREPAMRLAELQRAHQARTFAYLFDWPSPALGGALGSCHALELPFVFGTLDQPVMRSFVGAGPEARALAGRIQDAWIAFARTGDPSHAELGPWPAYDATRRSTMILGRSCRVESAPREPERVFWSRAAVSSG